MLTLDKLGMNRGFIYPALTRLPVMSLTRRGFVINLNEKHFWNGVPKRASKLPYDFGDFRSVTADETRTDIRVE